MKPNQEQLEDQLLDALLHEHNRTNREQALADIENALNEQMLGSPAQARPMWPKRLGMIAASIALGGIVVTGVNIQRNDKRNLAQLDEKFSRQERIAYSKKAILQEKDKVEDLKNQLSALDGTKFNETNREAEARLEALAQTTVPPSQKAAEASYLAEANLLEEMKLAQIDESFTTTSPSVTAAPPSSNPVPAAEIAMKKPATSSRNFDEVNKSLGDLAGSASLAGSGVGRGLGSGTGGGAGAGGGAGSVFGAGEGNGFTLRDKNTLGDATRSGDIPSSTDSINAERYGQLVDPTWQRPTEKPLSTFSIDVDTASYSNIRRMIREGRQIPVDAVRIEECINAFSYAYKTPTEDKAFAVHSELATCPWNKDNLLVKFGIKGREIALEKRPVSNLVFLIDVSGSMQSSNKLPLVKESLKLLLHQLDERDSVSYVVYAGSEGVVMPPTKMTEAGRSKALEALNKLESGGSTNGGAGIKRAYQLALENFIAGGVNRVILASDGDFNVGVTGQGALVELVKERAAKNIYLSVLAFGTGNLNDSMFEAICKDGNGNYFYIDTIREGRKVFLENLTGSLITIAKDVKIQVEFNPDKVASYRLIGYANRVLKDEDFNNDKVDAGDIGAGHTVTAFYEIVPAGLAQSNGGAVDALKYQKTTPSAVKSPTEPSDEWLTLKLRHKHAEGDISALEESVLKGQPTPWQKIGTDFQFATAVAMFGMKLRGMSEVSQISWEGVRELARSGLKDDKNEDRAEFVELIGELEKRSR